jgi:uncharacterized protein (TIGR02145 family)
MQELVFKTRRWLPALLALVVFTTCMEEPELPQKHYPVIFTREVTDITVNGATLSAKVVQGAEKITEYGFVWGTIMLPTLNNQSVVLTGDASDFSFRITTGIRDKQRYYVRAFTKTKQLTVYSNPVTFISEGSEGVIKLTTSAVSFITAYSAIAEGKILDDGFTEILEKGFVWGTSANPTLSGHDGMTREGNGMKAFTSIATNLKDESKYYIRTYAINRKDTAYAEAVSFTTLKNYIVYGNGITDMDGNHYPTVIIGDTEWMAKNLMTTKYSNGQAIRYGLSETLEGYTVYPHTWIENLYSQSYVMNAYGLLYNFHAVQDGRGLCPVGWKVPEQSDFDNLINHVMQTLGCNNDPRHPNAVGSHLKSSRRVNSPLGGYSNTTEHPRWSAPRWDAAMGSYGRDTFGFAGLPAGHGYSGNSFYSLGTQGSWWTTTISTYSRDYSSVAELDFYYNHMRFNSSLHQAARPVRCVKE